MAACGVDARAVLPGGGAWAGAALHHGGRLSCTMRCIRMHMEHGRTFYAGLAGGPPRLGAGWRGAVLVGRDLCHCVGLSRSRRLQGVETQARAALARGVVQGNCWAPTARRRAPCGAPAPGLTRGGCARRIFAPCGLSAGYELPEYGRVLWAAPLADGSLLYVMNRGTRPLLRVSSA
jgi:hypothetical protein